MSLKRATREVTYEGQTFVLRRPGRGGLARLFRHLSERVVGFDGQVSDTLLSIDGTGIEMEVVLHEYLADGPDEWRARGDDGKPLTTPRKQPAWDFEDVDAEAFAHVGEEAVAFHRSFRDVDARFGFGGRGDDDRASDVGAPDGVP